MNNNTLITFFYNAFKIQQSKVFKFIHIKVLPLEAGQWRLFEHDEDKHALDMLDETAFSSLFS